MAENAVRSTRSNRDEQLRDDPSFRAYWERTVLARAVALAVVGHRVKHGLTQTQLAAQLGVRQPQVARLEMGSTIPRWNCSKSWLGCSPCDSSWKSPQLARERRRMPWFCHRTSRSSRMSPLKGAGSWSQRGDRSPSGKPI